MASIFPKTCGFYYFHTQSSAMRHKFYLILICFSVISVAHAQDRDIVAIRKLLLNQVIAWNSGNIEGYMHGYWQSDSLLFIGSKGPRYGYDAALRRYREAYPDADHMGRLTSTLVSTQRLAPDYYFVVGKWALERAAGNVSGSYTLLLRKIKGKWAIVCDHSS